MARFENILCIGAGYVGGPTMAVMAKHCPDIQVVVADINAERIAAWQSGSPPLYEPGLAAALSIGLGRNLRFTADVEGAIAEARMIFVSVNTPTKTYGRGAGKAADLRYWEQTARSILKHARGDTIVVEKSTLPVRTAEAMERILRTGASQARFVVLSNPEFLAEGTAIRDLEHPDRVLIGGPETPEGRTAIRALADIYARWVPAERILTSNVWSAELSKLAANAFLAQRVSSINAISALCERTGANVLEVAHAIGSDRRIGSQFLRAGIGFGGSCFQKDILNLVYLCEHHGLGEVARYWEAVVAMNDYQQRRFVERMIRAMFNTLAEKRIAVFGFAFKADTGDTRNSPAIPVCRELLAEQARVCITDPRALESARHELADAGPALSFETDPYAAACGAHAIALLTDWEEYRTLDYARIFDSMEKPAFIFDGRNLFDPEPLYRLGFNYYSVGRPGRSRLDGEHAGTTGDRLGSGT
ncbi:MAG TPA: nucleotide sugar dehydrogenase [Vicinamibacteria bacterium]|nr:nucleotide sugar dehydrogenase [Vicinamibacteria bacterium]